MSGVTVPTMMTSMSAGVSPAFSMALSAAWIDDVPLPDSRALQNPLVRGVDHLLEIGVGQHARRYVSRQALDFDTTDVQNNPLAGIVRPKYS
jgi:hypothetical protein